MAIAVLQPSVGAALIAFLSAWALSPTDAQASACSPRVRAALDAPVDQATRPVEIACDLSLAKGDIITVPIAFSGSAASGATLDCNGAALDGTIPKARTIIIRSLRSNDGSWDAPRGITIRNCTIRGDIRIQGLGANGQGDQVRISSLSDGHTQRAQAAAPGGITLENNTFVASGGVPLYAAPGVTGMTVRNSKFTGEISATAIYLDAETAGNSIIGNTFAVKTGKREIIAVDGSAGNRISGNLFDNPGNGGIFLYRNCGEGGTIRHQSPQGNEITGNTFRYRHVSAPRPAVWLGSRQGSRRYCFSHPARPFGSSLDAGDHADNNTVSGNRFEGGSPALIVDDDRNNRIFDNR